MQSHMNDLFVQGNPLVNVDSSYLRKISSSHFLFPFKVLFCIYKMLRLLLHLLLYSCLLFIFTRKMENCKKLPPLLNSFPPGGCLEEFIYCYCFSVFLFLVCTLLSIWKINYLTFLLCLYPSISFELSPPYFFEMRIITGGNWGVVDCRLSGRSTGRWSFLFEIELGL